MMEYGWIVWVAAMVLFAIVEAATVSLVSVWFVGGSLAGFVGSMVFKRFHKGAETCTAAVAENVPA